MAYSCPSVPFLSNSSTMRVTLVSMSYIAMSQRSLVPALGATAASVSPPMPSPSKVAEVMVTPSRS